MEVPKGIYRHFKGGVYEVLCLAKHSETEEDMVIYRNVAEPEKIWARPLAMWQETVERDGRRFPRFTPMKGEEQGE